jgi:hypothetical protein
MTVKINHFIRILFFTVIIEASSFLSVQASIQEAIRYENKADFICGIPNQSSETKVLHDISITIFNPNDFPVMVNNFLALDAEDIVLKLELTDRYFSVLVSPKRNFTISCHYIKALFFPDQAEYQHSQEYFKGYIQSSSSGYLGIAFNYTKSSILNSRNIQGRQNEEN